MLYGQLKNRARKKEYGIIADTPDDLVTMIRKVKDYGGEFVLSGGMTLFGNKSSYVGFNIIMH